MKRWGIVGTGAIASAMAATLHAHPDAVPVAVASRSSDRAAAFAAEHGIDAATSVADLAARRDIDAVYIGSATAHHLADASPFLEAGIGVLCEKALAPDAADAGLMVDAARTHHTLLMEAMWMRFLPFWDVMTDLVADGAIGRVRYIRASFGIVANPDPGRRWLSPDLGGGAMLDVGIYPLTLACLLAGWPTSTWSTVTPAVTGVDGTVTVVLDHADGVTSNLAASLVTDIGGGAVVGGTAGRLEIGPSAHNPEWIRVLRRGELIDDRDVGYDGSGYRFEVDEIHRCLDEGWTESPTHPLETTLRIMGIIDEVTRTP